MGADATQSELPGTARWRCVFVCAGDDYQQGRPVPCMQELDPAIRKDVQMVGFPRLAAEQYPDMLRSIKPNILYLFGGFTVEVPPRDALYEGKRQKIDGHEVTVLGALKVAKERVDTSKGVTKNLPGSPLTPDTLVEMVRDYATESGALECVFLDGQCTDVLGAALREKLVLADGSPAVRHVICYPSVPHPTFVPANHFARAFFGALRTEGITVPEAYAMAVTSTYAHFQRHYHGTVVSGFAPPPVPLLLATPPTPSAEDADAPPPFPCLPSASSIPVDSLGEGWEDIQVLGSVVEAKLAVLGDRKISAPHRLACVADLLRALLVAEVRQLSSVQLSPLKSPPGSPANTVLVNCELRVGSRAPVQLLLRGPEATMKDQGGVARALRYLLAEEAATITFKVPPGTATTALMPAGAVNAQGPAILAHRSKAFGLGQKFVEVPMELPMWCFQTLKFMAADATSRDLINAGVAAVSGVPVLAMQQMDALYYSEALTYCSSPILDVQYISLQSYPPRPLQHILGGDPIPERTGPGRRPAVNQNTEDPNSVGQAGLLGLAVPRGVPLVGDVRYDQAEGLPKRPLLRDCSEEAFLRDVGAFWRAKQPKNKKFAPEVFPDAVLNGVKLDLFNLYKEVVSRGGFGLGVSINWKGNVWPKLKNFTAQNKQTAIGHSLKGHYQRFLLPYEECHPEDVKADRCVLCGGSEEQHQEFIQCSQCYSWSHYSCDKRPNLAPVKEYIKEGGKMYVCAGCADKPAPS